MWKDCENVSNYSHFQYCEWPSLVKLSQPFYSINGLLIKGSYFSFSFILPKNEAVTIFWAALAFNNSIWIRTIVWTLRLKKNQEKISLSCRLSKPILKTLTQTLVHTAENK